MRARTHTATMGAFQQIHCGSGCGLLLIARQVKAPVHASILLNKKEWTGVLHKHLIRERANY